jgi:hypothetical protein
MLFGRTNAWANFSSLYTFSKSENKLFCLFFAKWVLVYFTQFAFCNEAANDRNAFHFTIFIQMYKKLCIVTYRIKYIVVLNRLAEPQAEPTVQGYNYTDFSLTAPREGIDQAGPGSRHCPLVIRSVPAANNTGTSNRIAVHTLPLDATPAISAPAAAGRRSAASHRIPARGRNRRPHARGRALHCTLAACSFNL